MLRQRALVAILLLPLGIWLTVLGGLPFAVLIAVFLCLAAWEYAGLFRAGGFRPSVALAVAAVAAFTLGRHLNAGGDPFAWDIPLLAFFILAAMTVHLVDYERGAPFAGTDFAVTLSAGVYLGFAGSFLVSLRELPDGLWWFLTALPAVWFADSGAYFIGRWLGRTPFSPRLSPKKTWEGYLGGVLFGLGGGALMPVILATAAFGPIAPTPAIGAVLGLVLAVIAPLGDLGQSMLKRQVGIKDSSKLLPGHGGVFDRIDSWVWTGVIGYYLVGWLGG
ncbi:MAG TPA: phosphatidate cytidylyltransferase [Anaerolineales bacterium]|nr:phosphatidate cytidylyltransferase [Anaerolineales bacterium]